MTYRIALFFLTLGVSGVVAAEPLKFSNVKISVEDPDAPSRVRFTGSSVVESHGVPVEEQHAVPVRIQAVSVQEPSVSKVSLPKLASSESVVSEPVVSESVVSEPGKTESPQALQVLVAPVQDPEPTADRAFYPPSGFGLKAPAVPSGASSASPFVPSQPQAKADAEPSAASDPFFESDQTRVEKALPVGNDLVQAAPSLGGYTDLEAVALLNVAGRGPQASRFSPPVIGGVW